MQRNLNGLGTTATRRPRGGVGRWRSASYGLALALTTAALAVAVRHVAFRESADVAAVRAEVEKLNVEQLRDELKIARKLDPAVRVYEDGGRPLRKPQLVDRVVRWRTVDRPRRGPGQ